MNVQVKKVPDELHAALKARARARGTSLNDLLLDMLRREMARPTVEDWLAGVRDLGIRAEFDVEELMEEVKGPWPT